MVKSLHNITVHQFELITFDLLMGETQTPRFYDFGALGRVSEPKNNYFYLWRHQDT